MSEIWDPAFCDRAELFKTIRPVAAKFQSCSDWPTLAELNDLARERNLKNARGLSLVFVDAPPKTKSRRNRRQQNTGPSYEQRIYEAGEVPTRQGNWHDFFNALVWATFPRTKAAMNKLQFEGKRGPGRTREQDFLSMLDEGGILTCPTGERYILGHALYEAAMRGEFWVHGMVREVKVGDDLSRMTMGEKIAATDAALARELEAAEFIVPPTRPVPLRLSNL